MHARELPEYRKGKILKRKTFFKTPYAPNGSPRRQLRQALQKEGIEVTLENKIKISTSYLRPQSIRDKLLKNRFTSPNETSQTIFSTLPKLHPRTTEEFFFY
jgi:hypothetical protein